MKSRSKNRFAEAKEWTLKTFADPVAKRLKVRSAIKAGGIDPTNHNRRLLVVGR